MSGDGAAAATAEMDATIVPEAQSPKNLKEWDGASKGTLKACAKQNEATMNAVKALEKAEQDRIAAIEAEKARQKRLAAEAEERRRKEELRRQAEELKRQQAADLKARKEEAEQMKRDAGAALKAATAAFHQQAANDAYEKEKAYQQKSMNDCIQKLGNYICKCQHSCRMKFSQIMQCEMRLNMREERPATELFKDHVQHALDREWQVVKSARDEMMKLVMDGEKLRDEMEECMVLMTTGPSRANVARRCDKFQQLPHLKASAEAVPTSKELLKKTYSLVEKANAINAKSEETLLRTDADCSAVAKASSNALDKRQLETGTMQKNLATQRKTTRESIKDAEFRLMMMGMRASRTNGNDDKTKSMTAAAHALLGDLVKNKEAVEHDWRQKTHAFKIDRSARGLTKVRAGTFVSSVTPISSNPHRSQSTPAL